jgi:hypothetical protein
MLNQRRRVLLGAIALSILLPAGTAFAAEATSTKTDVKTLASAESKVVTLLHNYKATAAWKAKLESALAKQAAAEATLNGALAPKTKVAVLPTTTTSTTVTVPAPTSTSTTAPVPGVGGTHSFTDSNGVPYTVTLSQVIDPATGADGVANYGNQYIAAVFTITDTAAASATNGTTSDDADNDAVVIGSDDQTYTADFDGVTECTNFNGGNYDLSPGQSTTGCVVFQIPASVSPATVEWSADGGFGGTGTFGEWKV